MNNLRYRELFERSRNRWLWRTWVAPALYAAFSGVAEAIRWTQNHVEVGLFKLAEEVVLWPDEYVIYKHGVTEQNPHVWTPVTRVLSGTSVASQSHEGEWYLVKVTRPDEQCTCGAYKSDWDAAQILIEQVEDHARTALILGGLINRDVQ